MSTTIPTTGTLNLNILWSQLRNEVVHSEDSIESREFKEIEAIHCHSFDRYLELFTTRVLPYVKDPEEYWTYVNALKNRNLLVITENMQNNLPKFFFERQVHLRRIFPNIQASLLPDPMDSIEVDSQIGGETYSEYPLYQLFLLDSFPELWRELSEEDCKTFSKTPGGPEYDRAIDLEKWKRHGLEINPYTDENLHFKGYLSNTEKTKYDFEKLILEAKKRGKELEKIDLDSWSIYTFPPEIADVIRKTPLKILSLNSNQLISIEELGELPYLEILSLENNPIEFLPSDIIERFPNLKFINLNKTFIFSLPENLANTKHPLEIMVPETTEIPLSVLHHPSITIQLERIEQ